ncbi:hypothetical protein TNIN_203781 [Trichonephila inaurata madagascariensis]|uniref:Uncharacterized protein n=1 Tax=Trichonephila inaurata madagascariensis TaxID=2747483 RepID=A0A8X6XML9_9ARAC|nr:hypothetical protein TNIN_203781 [Trichonephila inaurata madagascariensis]
MDAFKLRRQEAYNIELEALEGYTEKMIAWQCRLKNIMKRDIFFGTKGQPQPGNNFVFISASSQDSVPAVFWRFDGLAAFPQPVQDNP